MNVDTVSYSETATNYICRSNYFEKIKHTPHRVLSVGCIYLYFSEASDSDDDDDDYDDDNMLEFSVV